MRKAKLEGNILPKAKQRLSFQGISAGEILHITRDVIEMSLGVIELPDQTRVPGGRVRAGEFTVTLQFARDHDRNAYLRWFEMCKDAGTDTAGVNPTYKRNGYMTYLRLFSGDPGTYASGRQADPVKVELIGCWPSSMRLPDYDMNGDESDGDCTLEVTVNFDDIKIESKYEGALGN